MRSSVELFTVLATLGSGEHYAVDLVLAFPYALLIEAVFSVSLAWKDRTRVSAAAFGLAAILLWFAAIFYTPHIFWCSPVLPWSLSVLTVLFSVHFEGSLHSYSDRVPVRLTGHVPRRAAA